MLNQQPCVKWHWPQEEDTSPGQSLLRDIICFEGPIGPAPFELSKTTERRRAVKPGLTAMAHNGVPPFRDGAAFNGATNVVKQEEQER